MSDKPDLEILGLISTQYASETHAAQSNWIDKTYLPPTPRPTSTPASTAC